MFRTKNKRPVRPIATMMVTIPDGSRKLVPKPSIGHLRQKRNRFYNWAEDADGKPYGERRVWDVPKDQYHLRMLVKGDIVLADQPRVEAPKKKTDAGADKKKEQ